MLITFPEDVNVCTYQCGHTTNIDKQSTNILLWQLFSQMDKLYCPCGEMCPGPCATGTFLNCTKFYIQQVCDTMPT